jgi:CubicO group peptidase (beta-lactamase class C family)
MTTSLVRLVGALTAVVTAAAVLVAAPRAQENAGSPAVDRLFAAWDRQDSPGCSIAVGRGGAVILERAYGMASLEHDVPLTPHSRFHAASITKQFTAMSVLLLARDGALSLDANVRRYVPSWDLRERVTIRHLLGHTSGLRDVFLLTELTSPQDGPVTDRLLALLARQRGTVFAPGQFSEYNNGAYLLLGDIVRRVSGLSLRAFMETRIFRPLGMSNTHVHDDPRERVPSLAIGYTADGPGLRLARLQGDVVGNAGLVTTVRDLLTWEHNFVAPRVGDASIVAAMQTPEPLMDGTPTPFGLGLQIETVGGRRTIGHGGGDQGISAYVVRYPDDGLAVAVLCNRDGIDATALSRGAADVYLGVAAGAAPAAPATVEPSQPAAQLASHVGLYRDARDDGLLRIFVRDARDDGLLRIFVRDGALRGSSGAGEGDDGWPLVPLAADRFRIPGTTIVLEFSGDAARHAVRVVGERPTPDLLERVTTFAVPATVLASYAGRYVSNELDVIYTLSVRDGALAATIPGRQAIALQPIAPDLFAGPLVGAIRFDRESGGAPAGFAIRAHAALNVRFHRLAD